MKFLALFCALLCPALAFGQAGVRYDGLTLSPSGRPLSANVAVCNSPGLATTAAQVVGNTAILTFGSSPITAGFAANMQIVVSGFTGGDTYFNVGTLTPFSSTVTIAAVSATTIAFPLTHANASASTNGSVFQLGNIANGCAPLASIFSDAFLAVPITQPGFVSSNVGNFGFFAASGSYQMQFYGPGVNTYLQPLTIQASLSANNAFTGNNTHSGTETFSGVETACQLNSVLYVGGSITCWAGADIGAQINTAYAALPSSGGRIHVLSQASCYAATTAISFATAGKPVLLEGDPGGPACISYAAASTSIVAVTLDYLSGPPQAAAGIRDIKFIGPGAATTSVGIKLGVANGAPYSTLSGLTFGSNGGATDGFGTDISFNFNSFGALIEKSQIQNATTGVSVSSGSESLRIDASSISHNTTGLSCNNGSDLYMWGHSIDDNSTGVSISGGCRVEFHGVHFENVSVSAASAAYGVCTGGELLFYGGQMQDDQVSGTTAQFIQANSGNCNIGIFGTLVHTLGRTLTQIVNFNGAGSGRGWLMPFYFSANVLSDFNQAYTAGPVFDLPMGTGSGPNNTAGFFGTTLQFKNSSGFISGPGANPYNLTINNPATSRALSISDPGGAAAFVFDLGAQSLSSKSFVNPAFLSVLGGNAYNFNVTNPASARTVNVGATDPGQTVSMPFVIASGTTTLTANAALAAVTSQAVNTTAATGTLTTDSIEWSFATAPTAGDNLCHVLTYVTAGNVNFVRTNPTAAAQNVSALVINWRVIR